jgi:hypothetical protein
MHRFPMLGRVLQHPGLRGHLVAGMASRRHVLLGGSLVALAGAVLATPRAHALTLENMRLPYEPGPERDGILSWRSLSSVTWFEGQGVMFAPEVEALDDTEVRLEGFMMPFDQAPLQRQFLLTAYAAHCPFCMPGGVPSLVEVIAGQPVPRTGSRLTMQGRLKLRRDPESYGLLYQMLDAVRAS